MLPYTKLGSLLSRSLALFMGNEADAHIVHGGEPGNAVPHDVTGVSRPREG